MRAAGEIADWLIVAGGEGCRDDLHFTETARELLRGLILYVATLPPERRHMGELRRIITLPDQALDTGSETLGDALSFMAATDEAHGAIKAAATSFIRSIGVFT